MAFSVSQRVSQVLNCANQSQPESTTEPAFPLGEASTEPPNHPTTLPLISASCTCHCSEDPKGEPF